MLTLTSDLSLTAQVSAALTGQLLVVGASIGEKTTNLGKHFAVLSQFEGRREQNV